MILPLLALGGCNPAVTGPEGLLPRLTGGWEGFVVAASLESRDVVAVFAAADGMYGTVAVEDSEIGVRVFELTEAVDVAPLGVSLRFIESTGVRELFVDAVVPIPPLYGSWRERVFCEEDPEGTCEVQGAVTLDRIGR